MSCGSTSGVGKLLLGLISLVQDTLGGGPRGRCGSTPNAMRTSSSLAPCRRGRTRRGRSGRACASLNKDQSRPAVSHSMSWKPRRRRRQAARNMARRSAALDSGKGQHAHRTPLRIVLRPGTARVGHPGQSPGEPTVGRAALLPVASTRRWWWSSQASACSPPSVHVSLGPGLARAGADLGILSVKPPGPRSGAVRCWGGEVEKRDAVWKLPALSNTTHPPVRYHQDQPLRSVRVRLVEVEPCRRPNPHFTGVRKTSGQQRILDLEPANSGRSGQGRVRRFGARRGG